MPHCCPTLRAIEVEGVAHWCAIMRGDEPKQVAAACSARLRHAPQLLTGMAARFREKRKGKTEGERKDKIGVRKARNELYIERNGHCVGSCHGIRSCAPKRVDLLSAMQNQP